MSRLTIYDALNGLALTSLAVLFAWSAGSGAWAQEEVLFLVALPLLLIGGVFAASLMLRRTRPEPAEECAASLVLPSVLVLGAMVASLA
ncbi:hypothetical protein ACE7GA_03280 [Roseomonas sp. CCTCC AB2023176]|uniref:hypothetical protein n=1 Tax=Roseomonas sp. CCTCC AB2023176 TaxID=3342640 RepID=UPI0035DA9F63